MGKIMLGIIVIIIFGVIVLIKNLIEIDREYKRQERIIKIIRERRE